MNHLQVKQHESGNEEAEYFLFQMNQTLLVYGFQLSTRQGWPWQDHLETSV
jgi:hypothetical protein